MRLGTAFKSALVTTGLGLSTLGFVAGKSHVTERNGQILVTAAEEADYELGLAHSATTFFAGTTLIALGARRRKTAPKVK